MKVDEDKIDVSENGENGVFEDDGRTVFDMNVEGMPGYNKNRDKHRVHKKNLEDLNLTRREKRSLILASYGVIIPVALVFLGLFAGVLLFFQFVWFK